MMVVEGLCDGSGGCVMVVEGLCDGSGGGI